MILRVAAYSAAAYFALMNADPWATTVEDEWGGTFKCLPCGRKLAIFQPGQGLDIQTSIHSVQPDARCPIPLARDAPPYFLIFRVCSGPQQTRLWFTGTREEFTITRMTEELYRIAQRTLSSLPFQPKPWKLGDRSV